VLKSEKYSSGQRLSENTSLNFTPFLILSGNRNNIAT
jgi:hypothetical protein